MERPIKPTTKDCPLFEDFMVACGQWEKDIEKYCDYLEEQNKALKKCWKALKKCCKALENALNQACKDLENIDLRADNDSYNETNWTVEQ